MTFINAFLCNNNKRGVPLLNLCLSVKLDIGYFLEYSFTFISFPMFIL